LKSEILAQQLWERLIPFLEIEDINGVKPYGFGAEGVWVPTSVNPCFRFCKYEKGGHFQKHRDGGFVWNDEKRSIFTLLIYLNDDF
jgi:hypothetical protein